MIAKAGAETAATAHSHSCQVMLLQAAQARLNKCYILTFLQSPSSSLAGSTLLMRYRLLLCVLCHCVFGSLKTLTGCAIALASGITGQGFFENSKQEPELQSHVAASVYTPRLGDYYVDLGWAADYCRPQNCSVFFPESASVSTMPRNPSWARRPFQFSAYTHSYSCCSDVISCVSCEHVGMSSVNLIA